MKKTPSAEREKEKETAIVKADGEEGASGEEKKEGGCKLKYCSKLCRDRCESCRNSMLQKRQPY